MSIFLCLFHEFYWMYISDDRTCLCFDRQHLIFHNNTTSVAATVDAVAVAKRSFHFVSTSPQTGNNITCNVRMHDVYSLLDHDNISVWRRCCERRWTANMKWNYWINKSGIVSGYRRMKIACNWIQSDGIFILVHCGGHCFLVCSLADAHHKFMNYGIFYHVFYIHS